MVEHILNIYLIPRKVLNMWHKQKPADVRNIQVKITNSDTEEGLHAEQSFDTYERTGVLLTV